MEWGVSGKETGRVSRRKTGDVVGRCRGEQESEKKGGVRKNAFSQIRKCGYCKSSQKSTAGLWLCVFIQSKVYYARILGPV